MISTARDKGYDGDGTTGMDSN